VWLMKATFLKLAVVGCGTTNPIVEKAIRKELKKPTGELTKADLEKVTWLELQDNQLTNVKGLEEQRTFKIIK